MKKIIYTLWLIFALAVLIFGITVFSVSTKTTWDVFSVAIPVAGLSFTGAVILTVVYSLRSKK